MYQTYKDEAEFFIVYISEAHAADSKWPVGYAKEKGINKHTTYGERCAVAKRLVADKKLTLPCLIDTMENNVAKAYKGLPDRVFLVDVNGNIAVSGRRGPWGFKPALNASREWLADYANAKKSPPTEAAASGS